MHPLAGIEAVGVGPQLVAGHLDLGAAVVPGHLAGVGEESAADPVSPVAGVHHKFHDLRHPVPVVQLLLKAQIQNAHALAAPLVDQAAVVFALQLSLEDLGEPLEGELPLLHIADEAIHRFTILPHRLAEHRGPSSRRRGPPAGG